jgi:hypothetical protein
MTPREKMGEKLPLSGVLRPSRQDVSSELKNRRGAKCDRAHFSAHFGSARRSQREMKEVNVCAVLPLPASQKLNLFLKKWFNDKS